VLHKLRDRFRSALRLIWAHSCRCLVRGVYYDQFEPAKLPTECNNREEFVAEVAEWLADTRPVDPDQAVSTVFKVLSRHVSQGQIEKVKEALPKSLRQSWETAEQKSPEAADA
jgi:uncharacterized protein (DUF2267 family)